MSKNNIVKIKYFLTILYSIKRNPIIKKVVKIDKIKAQNAIK
jgi:hypothetical protein